MIDTCNTAPAHFTDGCHRIGSGPLIIVILGSCRIFPFVNYLNRANKSNEFTIVVIYVVNFSSNTEGKTVDEYTESFASNPVLANMIGRCEWFIHEHTENYGIFNTSKESARNIYQLGMNPVLDISIPNFNDHFILENDWKDCGMTTPPDYEYEGLKAVEKFCDVCLMTSFPEMADYFDNRWREKRFFYRPNHTSKEFTLYIFRRMNDQYLGLNLDYEFWLAAEQEDLFKTPHTEVTENDVYNYRLQWR